jgi:hypothetical protein
VYRFILNLIRFCTIFCILYHASCMFFVRICFNFQLLFFTMYRKSGYYGTNFDFDARLRCYRVLECIASKGGLVNLDLNFIFFSHSWYIFWHYTTFKCKKPQNFVFQILRVIWDKSVFKSFLTAN